MLEPQNAIVFEKILLATDFTSAADATFAYAATITDRYQSQLYDAHVISLDVFDLINAESIPAIPKLPPGWSFMHFA